MGATFIPRRISEQLDTSITGVANDDFLQRKSGAWANRTVAQVKADLGLPITAFDGTVGATTPSTIAATTGTFSGQVTASANGAASAPAVNITGVPFAGTGTTSFPLVYINETGATASASLNTAGTLFGVNGNGTADLMNLLKDGVSQCKITSGGVLTVSALSVGGAYSPTSIAGINSIGNINGNVVFSPASGDAAFGLIKSGGQFCYLTSGSGGSAFGFKDTGFLQFGRISSLSAVSQTNDLKITSTGAVEIGNTLAVTGSTAMAAITASGDITLTDAIIGRKTAANLRQGAADAAAPVAQTFSVQNVSTGTSNTAGANRYYDASQGTGTGAGGSHIFRTAPAGGAGSSQNALAAALTIAGSGSATFAGAIITTPQSLSGAGAINLTTGTTAFISTGAAQVLTLADGVHGQIKTIVHVSDGGSGVITPTTACGYSTITVTNAGDAVTLQFFTTAGWCIVGIFGAVAA